MKMENKMWDYNVVMFIYVTQQNYHFADSVKKSNRILIGHTIFGLKSILPHWTEVTIVQDNDCT